jgi:methyl-accepting chemotaxis protein
MNPLALFNLNSKLGLEQRRRSMLLRLVIIILLLAIPILAGMLYFLSIYLNAATLILFVVLLVAQVLNRAGLVRIAAWLAILAVSGATFYYLAQPPGSIDPLTRVIFLAPLLLIPILISGATVGPYAPLLVSLVSAVGLIVLTVATISRDFRDLLQGVSIIVFLIFLTGLISWVFERYVVGLLSQLTLRNDELELRNRELDSKRNLEQHIGDRINVLAAQVSSASAEQSRGANDQLSGIVEATTTLEQLNQTNKQIARAAQQVAGSAQEALQVAEHGGETIKTSVQAMSMLQDRVGNIANSMEDLFRQSQEIDQIIELISGVADETNLLALNATIEAAGAREYGRRFAAVANEVQRLAGRTSEAAESVRAVISEVQDAIKKAAGVTKEGLEDATRVSASASEVGQTIEGMVQMVQNTAILAQQISFSIQQQESAGTQIVDTMRQISDVSRQMTESSQDLLQSIFELNETADKLRELEDLMPGGPKQNQLNLFEATQSGSNNGYESESFDNLALR